MFEGGIQEGRRCSYADAPIPHNEQSRRVVSREPPTRIPIPNAERVRGALVQTEDNTFDDQFLERLSRTIGSTRKYRPNSELEKLGSPAGLAKSGTPNLALVSATPTPADCNVSQGKRPVTPSSVQHTGRVEISPYFQNWTIRQSKTSLKSRPSLPALVSTNVPGSTPNSCHRCSSKISLVEHHEQRAALPLDRADVFVGSGQNFDSEFVAANGKRSPAKEKIVFGRIRDSNVGKVDPRSGSDAICARRSKSQSFQSGHRAARRSRIPVPKRYNTRQRNTSLYFRTALRRISGSRKNATHEASPLTMMPQVRAIPPADILRKTAKLAPRSLGLASNVYNPDTVRPSRKQENNQWGFQRRSHDATDCPGSDHPTATIRKRLAESHQNITVTGPRPFTEPSYNKSNSSHARLTTNLRDKVQYPSVSWSRRAAVTALNLLSRRHTDRKISDWSSGEMSDTLVGRP